MNVTLRPWKPEDAESLVRYANEPAIAANMTDTFPHPYLPEHALRFIETANSETPPRILAIDAGEGAIGSIGLHPLSDIFRKNAELGYWLGLPFHGRGIMTEAVRQMVQYGFEHFDFTRIFARPFGTNTGSQRVLEKAGFTLEARLEKTFYKNDVYIDELIYAVRKMR